jgi:hypothetical protein
LFAFTVSVLPLHCHDPVGCLGKAPGKASGLSPFPEADFRTANCLADAAELLLAQRETHIERGESVDRRESGLAADVKGVAYLQDKSAMIDITTQTSQSFGI